jgi:uncharacterized repeat protein (TIGR01451 family)
LNESLVEKAVGEMDAEPEPEPSLEHQRLTKEHCTYSTCKKEKKMSILTKGLRFLFILALVLTMGIVSVPMAHADTIIVACNASDLITAINTANGNGEDDTIILETGCTYTLSSANAADPDGYGPVGLPPITSNIAIQGNGATITRSGSDPFRFFYVSDTGNLTLENLTLSNGLAQGGNGGQSRGCGGGGAAGIGGAILNRGTLTVSGVTLTDNTAQGGDGNNDGGPYWGGGGGGGLGGDGATSTGNPGGDGGGVNGGVGGPNINVPGGDATGPGGGGGGAGYGGSFGGAGGFGGGGGGASAAGNDNGGTGGFGGGGGGWQGSASSTAGFGGGDGVQWGGGGGGGFGGAIFNLTGTLTITNSTLTGNMAQGGNGLETSGNEYGGGGSGYGGAVFNYNGTFTATNATIANNTVVAGTGDVGGDTDGGGIYNYQDSGGTASLTLKNTILADTPSSNTDCYNNNGTVTGPASNRNLIENNAVGGNACGTPYSTGDPNLAPLADNGGDTWTHALQAGSPAIDAGTDDGAPATDQRVVARPQGTAYDIGAYEKGQANLSLAKTVDDETPNPGQLITYMIIVNNSGAINVTSALISDTLPSGLTFAVGSITLDPPGAGTAGTTPPTLASDVTINPESSITVTFQATVNTGLAAGTVITNTATGTGTPPFGPEVQSTDSVTVTLESAPAPPGGTVYLPLILHSSTSPAPAPGSGPDLIVERITATSDSVQVVIKNQGDAPVLPGDDDFWVDFYVNPNPIPTGVNQVWNDGRSDQGIVWGVTAPDLPLEPGGVITLTNGGTYYWPSLSNFSGSLPAGTPVYAQVDSANTNTTYGAVLENHESIGGTYNNISGSVVSTLSVMGEELAEAESPVTGDHPPIPSGHLPPRP